MILYIIQIPTIMVRKIFEFEVGRYIVNGLFATIIHYSVLTINMDFIGFRSAGLANFIAAFFGIFASYMGNRHFVFKAFSKPILKQSIPFIVLYSLLALVHGIVLYVWTDLYNFDYRIGFIIASVVQFFLSFFGNKVFVFKS